jgi:hypothetical protein
MRKAWSVAKASGSLLSLFYQIAKPLLPIAKPLLLRRPFYYLTSGKKMSLDLSFAYIPFIYGGSHWDESLDALTA